MKNSEQLYSIGTMAKISNVTTKLLRYYDANHIVSPAYKDAKTGYRYYTEKQLADILFVKELKKLNFSLEDIASLLNERELLLLKKKLFQRLQKSRIKLEQAREYFDQTLDMLMRVDDIIQLKDPREQYGGSLEEIQLVEIPERLVLFSRYPSYWNADTIFIDRRAELYKLADQYQLQTYGSVSAVFHGDYLKQFSSRQIDMIGDLEVCLNIKDAKDCPQVRKIGGGKAVSTVYLGHYRYMRPVYLKMKAWAAVHGYRLADYSIEEYLCGVTMTSIPEEFVTRLYLPVLDQDSREKKKISSLHKRDVP